MSVGLFLSLLRPKDSLFFLVDKTEYILKFLNHLFIYLGCHVVTYANHIHCSGSHKPGQEGLPGAGEGHDTADPVQPPRHRRQDVCGHVRSQRYAAKLTNISQV